MAQRGIVFIAIWILLNCSGSNWAQQNLSRNPESQNFSVGGQVLSAENGQPVEMLKVELTKITGDRSHICFTNSRGKFYFEELSSGEYYVEIRENGYDPVNEKVELRLLTPSQQVLILLRKSLKSEEKPAQLVVSTRELAIPRKAHDAFIKGAERLYDDDYMGSVVCFQRAVSMIPGYYEAYHLMGIAYERMVKPIEAEQSFRKSIDLSGNKYIPSYAELASLLSSQNRFAEAEVLARRIVELNGNAWQGHYELAQAQLGLNQLENAEKSAWEARRLKTNLPLVHFMLANILIRRNNIPAFIEELNVYLKLEPDEKRCEQAKKILDKFLQSEIKPQAQNANSPIP